MWECGVFWGVLKKTADSLSMSCGICYCTRAVGNDNKKVLRTAVTGVVGRRVEGLKCGRGIWSVRRGCGRGDFRGEFGAKIGVKIDGF